MTSTPENTPAPRSDAVLSAATAAVLAKLVSTARKEADAAVLAELEPGDKVTAKVDGHKLGRVLVKEPAVTTTVTDPHALARYCEQHYATEVEYKPVVRPAFLARIVAASKEAGTPCMPDGTPDVPGVSVTTGDSTVAVYTAADAAESLRHLYQSGAMSLPGLLQIEGPK